jgi:dTDP-4-amino-4,6-dideoxy-D-galactose acyltransferase
MIKQLKWDTKFFGYKIGQISISDNKSFSPLMLEKSVNDYKLVYVLSPGKIDMNGLKLVDKKVIFQQKTSIKDNLNKNVSSKIESFNEGVHDYESLKKLALSSGINSRFKIDKNFKNNEYTKLYNQWINNAVYKDKALDILTYREKEILGFTTIEKKSKYLAVIGLVAVSEQERGKGIASKLIESSINRAFELGFETIQVATQFENIPAMRLYEKCDFKIKDITYIYHYWNL